MCKMAARAAALDLSRPWHKFQSLVAGSKELPAKRCRLWPVARELAAARQADTQTQTDRRTSAAAGGQGGARRRAALPADEWPADRRVRGRLGRLGLRRRAGRPAVNNATAAASCSPSRATPIAQRPPPPAGRRFMRGRPAYHLALAWRPPACRQEAATVCVRVPSSVRRLARCLMGSSWRAPRRFSAALVSFNRRVSSKRAGPPPPTT
jgi:hypothetical protein